MPWGRTSSALSCGRSGSPSWPPGRARRGEVRAWVRRLLRAGVRLDDLRKLAIGKGGLFGERYDVDPVIAPPAEPDLTEGMDALSRAVQGLRGFCDAACSDPTTEGCGGSLDLCEACERVLSDAPADIDELMARVYAIPFKATQGGLGGRKDNWSDAHGGKDALWERYRAAADELLSLRDEYATYVERLAVAVADRFTRWADQKQGELGLLDFSDLLGRLRDLLRNDLEARRLLQRRFRYLLVDEFQDTDPLQAEIVFYLCEQEPVAERLARRRPDARASSSWWATPSSPSTGSAAPTSPCTTRSRTWSMASPAGPAGSMAIEQNFRTTPAVVAGSTTWSAPCSWRGEGAAAGLPAGPAVPPRRRRVARRRAPRAALRWRRRFDGGRPARRGAGGRGAPRRHAGRRRRAVARPRVRDTRVRRRRRAPPRWGDVAILYRTTTGLETLEEALRRAGVPYRVDGGKTYFERREVDDALLCLRAVDDPSDGPAVYGALHSTFFGFSDDELFLYWAGGGRFDVFAAGARTATAPSARRSRVLRGLHEARPRASRTSCSSSSSGARTPRRRWRRPATGVRRRSPTSSKLVERARAFAGAGGGGLAAFLAWAAEAGDAAGEQESQVDDEGDVRRC